jgi:hypothetical protein
MTAKLTAEMKRVVSEQRLAYVATVCPDGTPNVSPKGTIAVWDDDQTALAKLSWPPSSVPRSMISPSFQRTARLSGSPVINGSISPF